MHTREAFLHLVVTKQISIEEYFNFVTDLKVIFFAIWSGPLDVERAWDVLWQLEREGKHVLACRKVLVARVSLGATLQEHKVLLLVFNVSKTFVNESLLIGVKDLFVCHPKVLLICKHARLTSHVDSVLVITLTLAS